MQLNNISTINFGRLYMPTNHQIAKQWGKNAGEASQYIHDAVSPLAKEIDIYITHKSKYLYNVKVGPKHQHTVMDVRKREDLLSACCTKKNLLNNIKNLKEHLLSAKANT